MLSRLLRRFGLGRIAYNTVVATFWQYVRIAAQALWLIAIARSLGPAGYGSFAGLAGLAITMSGLSGFGTSLLLLKNVSVDLRTLSTQWRKAIFTTLISGIALTAIFLVVARLVSDAQVPWFTLALIGASELICVPFVNVASFVFQAHERISWASALLAAVSAARFIGAAILWLSAEPGDLSVYACYHFGASLLVTLFAIGIVRYQFRPSPSHYQITRNEMQEGLSFSSLWFTSNALTELDKTLTLKLAGSEAAGIYSAAYRLSSVLAQPVIALANAVQPRLFRLTKGDLNDRSVLVRRLATTSAQYGIVASLALLLCASFLPVLLGAAFSNAAHAAWWLVALPPVFSLRLVGSTVLMTTGRQTTRLLVEACGVGLLIGLCCILIPILGFSGTAIATTVTETVLALGTWIILWNSVPLSRSRARA